jgi:hypothetical protein
LRPSRARAIFTVNTLIAVNCMCAGLLFRSANAKASFDYRADEFFGANAQDACAHFAAVVFDGERSR